MTIPTDFPAPLRDLLDAELAAGNVVDEVGSYFPAPPIGAFYKMKAPVTTRPHESANGLTFRDFGTSAYSGSFTDDRGIYFILEPGIEPPPEPDMDAIRAAHAPKPFQPNPKMGRFERSMVIDYEKWHDGIGYDLDAIREATPEELNEIERLLLNRGARDWRDVEALAALGTARSQEVLKGAMTSPDASIRMAVVQHVPDLITPEQRAKSLVHALQSAKLYEGLSQALDDAAEFHPPEVIEALMDGALHRDGETAVHFAALLMFIFGKADCAFDWDQRPFFLRFNTDDPDARAQVFAELRVKIAS